MTDIETWSCESCNADIPLDDAIMSEGCTFCPACWAEFQAGFKACSHEWEEHYDEMGDKGRYCTRCAGFVADQDFASVFPEG